MSSASSSGDCPPYDGGMSALPCNTDRRVLARHGLGSKDAWPGQYCLCTRASAIPYGPRLCADIPLLRSCRGCATWLT